MPSAVVRSGFRLKGISDCEADAGDAVLSPHLPFALFADAHAVEGVQGKRTDLETLHVFAHRLIHRRVGDRCHRHLLFDQLLCLFIKLCALSNIGGGFGGLDQFVELRVTPLGEVVAFNRVAAKQGAEPVVRVTVVATPADCLWCIGWPFCYLQLCFGLLACLPICKQLC